MSRGQDQLQEAADSCAAAAASADTAEATGGRLKQIEATILELKESTFAKSGLSVPLTAGIGRAAKAVLEAVGADGVDERVDALEKAIEDFSGKAGGAGGIAIT